MNHWQLHLVCQEEQVLRNEKKIPKREIWLILFTQKSKEVAFQYLFSFRKAIAYMLLGKKFKDPIRDQEQTRTISSSRKWIGSKDHRIIPFGRYLWSLSSPASSWKQGQLWDLTNLFVCSLVLKTFKDCTISLNNLFWFLFLANQTVKKFFLKSNLTLSFFNFCPLFLIIPSCSTGSMLQDPLKAISSPCWTSLSFSLWGKSFNPWLSWWPSAKLAPFLNWDDKSRGRYIAHSLQR